MYTENGVLIDLNEVMKVVNTCDVFTIGFRLFPQRLLVDTRYNADEGPMVMVVEPVATVEERFYWLGRKRPRFSAPRQFTFFVWPHSVQLLEDCGVADAVRARCRSPQWPQGDYQVDAALWELRQLERRAVREAVLGQHCRTIWPRN